LTSTDTQMRLLIIEDDRESADYLVKAFREVGYVADLASDGEEGLALADTGDYDVLVIDRMLPKRDGLSLIGTLRDKGNRTPALILSALGQVDDRIKGLRAGGDDYLPKPYSFAELLARVEVLSRRHGGPAEETTYRVGDLELDRLSHRVARGKDELTAGISNEARRPGGDANHAAGKCLGLSFRSPDQCYRCAYFAAALQDRQGFRTAVASHHSRRGVHDP
jgi:two-component system OmpR family response regulator